MMVDKIQPTWGKFWHQAYPTLNRNDCSLDELRRLEIAARYWHASVRQALEKRQATFGRKAA